MGLRGQVELILREVAPAHHRPDLPGGRVDGDEGGVGVGGRPQVGLHGGFRGPLQPGVQGGPDLQAALERPPPAEPLLERLLHVGEEVRSRRGPVGERMDPDRPGGQGTSHAVPDEPVGRHP